MPPEDAKETTSGSEPSRRKRAGATVSRGRSPEPKASRTNRSGANAGERAERLVESILIRSGWFPLARNHHCPRGEVDLVMLHGEVVVFVEVRERRSGSLVDALSSVTPAKQRKVVRAAMDYAMRAGLRDRALRFDVVAVTRKAGAEPQVEHVENAFDASVLEVGRER